MKSLCFDILSLNVSKISDSKNFLASGNGFGSTYGLVSSFADLGFAVFFSMEFVDRSFDIIAVSLFLGLWTMESMVVDIVLGDLYWARF